MRARVAASGMLPVHTGIESRVAASPPGMMYLDVRLWAGERWVFQPPRNDNVAWIASHQGIVKTPSEVSVGEAVVFEEAAEAYCLRSR